MAEPFAFTCRTCLTGDASPPRLVPLCDECLELVGVELALDLAECRADLSRPNGRPVSELGERHRSIWAEIRKVVAEA